MLFSSFLLRINYGLGSVVEEERFSEKENQDPNRFGRRKRQKQKDEGDCGLRKPQSWFLLLFPSSTFINEGKKKKKKLI